MRLLIGFLSLLMAIAPTVSAREAHLTVKVPDRVEDDLNGPVRKVLTDECRNLSTKHTKAETRFDRRGNLLSEIRWNENDKVIFQSTNTYDADGCHLLTHTEDIEKGATNDWEIVVNAAALKIAECSRQTGHAKVLAYSPEKYLLHGRTIDRDKKLISAFSYKRRPDNKEYEFTAFGKNNRPDYTITIKWNDRLHTETETVRYHQEDKQRLNTFEYIKVDQHGNWTQRIKTRYNLDKSGKEKVYDLFTVRTIEYFEE